MVKLLTQVGQIPLAWSDESRKERTNGTWSCRLPTPMGPSRTKALELSRDICDPPRASSFTSPSSMNTPARAQAAEALQLERLLGL